MGTTTLCQKNVTSHEISFTFCGVVFTSASAFTQRVSLSVKAETTLNEVLKQVKDQTGVRILYDAGKMKRVPCREMKITDLEIAEALKQILKDTRFEFFEEGGVFIVREVSLQQAKMIRLVGKVTDEKKTNPLPGVTVQLKGFSVGTATNGAGMYQLSIPNAPEKFSLVFSFVGMVSQEIVYARERHDRRGDEGGRGDVGRRGCHRLHDLGQE